MPRNGSAGSRKRTSSIDAYKHVLIRFYEELNDFLRPDIRKNDLDFSFYVPPTVKDVIESFGVPHVEVDLILINGESAGFETRVRNGDRISVYPTFERLDISAIAQLRAMPLRRPAFVADVHLRKLARWMRQLGLDVAHDPSASDRELIRKSLDENRILLTRDRALLRHGILTHGYWVRAIHPREQVVEILRRLNLGDQVHPFTRCTICNSRLWPVDKCDVLDRIPPRTAMWLNEYVACEGCGKLYWKGTHFLGMQQSIKEMLLEARSPR